MRRISVVWSTSDAAVAIVSSSGVVCAQDAGVATITVTTNDGGFSATCEVTVVLTTGTDNGHAWVELGLPSGIKWATRNVGANTPEGYGNYFAWGETGPRRPQGIMIYRASSAVVKTT